VIPPRDIRKKPELSTGARSLTLQARSRQSSFLPCARDEVTGNGFYLRCNLAQEGATLTSRDTTEGAKSLGRNANRKFHFFRSCRQKSRLQTLPACGIHGVGRLPEPLPSRNR
jgi:hypothetical protein